MIVEQLVEWELAGETEVLGENLPQCYFGHHKSHITWARNLSAEMGSRRLTSWAMARPQFRTYNPIKLTPNILFFSLSMPLQLFLRPWPRFQFHNPIHGRTPWTGDQPVAWPLPTHRTAQTHNKRTQTSMPWVRFEPTTPSSERAKTVHALDRATTVIGTFCTYCPNFRTNVVFQCSGVS
jgi:hypothetical protein